jgi:hypothetical protein
VNKTYICIFDFQCVAINIKVSLKICTSYLVYSQFWLNLHRDDHNFPIENCHLSSMKKIPNENCAVCVWGIL